MNLPRSTLVNGEVIPPDRIVGPGLVVKAARDQALGDLFTYSESHEEIERQIAEHVRKNKRRLQVPKWHHWRLWRLAITWRWCKS